MLIKPKVLPCGCCNFISVDRTQWQVSVWSDNIKQTRKRSGICLFDPKLQKILIVQNCFNKYGVPKGKQNITDICLKQTAQRETFEEVGIHIPLNKLNKSLIIDYNFTLYLYECDSTIVTPKLSFSDATGAGWIKISCLSQIPLNMGTKKLLSNIDRFLNK